MGFNTRYFTVHTLGNGCVFACGCPNKCSLNANRLKELALYYNSLSINSPGWRARFIINVIRLVYVPRISICSLSPERVKFVTFHFNFFYIYFRHLNIYIFRDLNIYIDGLICLLQIHLCETDSGVDYINGCSTFHKKQRVLVKSLWRGTSETIK